MIWIALANAFAAGLNLSLAVWNLAERDYSRATWRVVWTFIGASLAVICAVDAL